VDQEAISTALVRAISIDKRCKDQGHDGDLPPLGCLQDCQDLEETDRNSESEIDLAIR